jgi:hypothetical protein
MPGLSYASRVEMPHFVDEGPGLHIGLAENRSFGPRHRAQASRLHVFLTFSEEFLFYGINNHHLQTWQGEQNADIRIRVREL